MDELKKEEPDREATMAELEYSVLVENSLDGILKLENEKIAFANSAAITLFGYNYSELLNLRFKDLISSESKEVLRKRKAQKEAGEVVSPVFELIAAGKSGLKIFIEIVVVPIGSDDGTELIYVKDITERKKAQKSLEELNQELREVTRTESEYSVLVENSLDSILKLENEKITFANSAAITLFGYNYSELLNLRFKDLISSESKKILEKRRVQKEAGEVIPPVFELIGIRKNGLRMFIEAIIVFVESDGGTELVYVKDITECKKAQKALKKLNQELEGKVKQRTAELLESNRLKDLFNDIMRHDFLNPVGAVKMNIQTALMGKQSKETGELLRRSYISTVRLIEMIENASIISKLESKEKLKFKQEDIGVILKKSLEDMIPKAEEREMKIMVGAKGVFPVVVNPLVQNVFSNLIDNAIKYGPENSKIVVMIKKDGANWKVSVADKGEGISDKYKQAIFERFTRLEKGSVRGSGLGLAIVKKIVEVHNGKVWVEDNPGGGSIFYVSFPIKRTQKAKAIKSVAVVARKVKNRVTSSANNSKDKGGSNV